MSTRSLTNLRRHTRRLAPPMIAVFSSFSVLLALQSVHLLLCDARPTFVQRIPNGALMPGVRAIGHQNPNGGGPTNAFGDAFEAQGAQWTKAICEADSDGDGATNGEELGDPCCQWQPGLGSAGLSSIVSHPGVPNTFTDAQIAALRCRQQASADTATPPMATSSAPSVVSTTVPPATMDGTLLPADSSPSAPISSTSAEDPASTTDGDVSITATPSQRPEASAVAPSRTPEGTENSSSGASSLSAIVVTVVLLQAVTMGLQQLRHLS